MSHTVESILNSYAVDCCYECGEWDEKKSDGNGLYCNSLKAKVALPHYGAEHCPVPDDCPRLSWGEV